MPPQTKTCERCQREYLATEQYFDLNRRYKDQLKTTCRACGPAVAAERRKRKNERSREWARANREKVRESARRAWQKNRRERLAYLRRWREENQERIREYGRQYRAQRAPEKRQQAEVDP
jgi:hypothetical protein